MIWHEHEAEGRFPAKVNSVELVKIFSSTVTAGKPIENFGPFRTKSEAELAVLFAFGMELDWQDLFNYDEQELARVNEDIRGFRIYEISGLKRGVIGGTEFHQIRKEIVIVAKGSIVIQLEDLSGRQADFTLTRGQGVWIPPFIKHTYRVLENDTRLVAIANTLFDPTNSTTFDTYSDEEFERLKTLPR